MIKLTNAKTGEVTYYPEKDERITVEKFKQMLACDGRLLSVFYNNTCFVL